MRPVVARIVALLALVMPLAAHAAAPAPDPNRLFADSRLVVRDRISVEVVGQGPDVVLIPAMAASRAAWLQTAQRLKDRYRLHLVQVAGFAGEPARGNAQGPVVRPTTEDIDGYIRDSHLGPAIVIGHSQGASMALLLAERHPRDVAKAMIIDSLPYNGVLVAGFTAMPEGLKTSAAGARDAMAKADPDAYRDSVIKSMGVMAKATAAQDKIAGWSLASDRSVVSRALYDDLQVDLRPDLEKTTAPITILYPDFTPMGVEPGAMDVVFPQAYLALANHQTKAVQKSLHYIMYDQPAAFDAAVDAFLAG